MRYRLLPTLVGTVVAVATGGGFHLTPGDLTIATLVTGLFSAGVVSFFQSRGKHETSDDIIQLLKDAQVEIHDLRDDLEAKQELIDELHRDHRRDGHGD